MNQVKRYSQSKGFPFFWNSLETATDGCRTQQQCLSVRCWCAYSL